MEKCAVFSCMGLGDGLIALVLSHNLAQNDKQVTTFHPFLSSMQSWFPTLPIAAFPKPSDLKGFDRFFFIYEKSSWMQELLRYCEEHYPTKTHVLNPIATSNQDYKYWNVGKFDGRNPLVDNLVTYCADILGLQAGRGNGIRIPEGVVARKYPKRVVLHPLSSRPGKDWPKEKFLKLAERLSGMGYEPLFILNGAERVGWEEVNPPVFKNLDEMARAVCESGYMIGNDSGIGHLASCLGVPTVTVCRSAVAARFWRPAWAKGVVVTPYDWIPNLKGLRWRDQHWKKWISVQRVVKNFHRLVCE